MINEQVKKSKYKQYESEDPISPKRAFRLQAGVKPLQEQAITLALKGRKNILSPLWGWGYTLLFTGVSPLPVVLSGLRPLGWET